MRGLLAGLGVAVPRRVTPTHPVASAFAKTTARQGAPPLFIEGISRNLIPLYEEGCPTGRGVLVEPDSVIQFTPAQIHADGISF
jgi:hypothetical protein